MKIPMSEFKNVIKECLKELIAEGALNNTISQMIQTQGIPLSNVNMQNTHPQVNPAIQALAQSMTRNGGDSKLMEAIFADAYNTMHYQNGVDPQNMMQNMGGMMGNPMMPQMNQGYFNGYPQQQMMQMPQYQQQMMPQMQMQRPMMPAAQQGNSGMNRWAELAFNSPIKNRPDAEGGFGGSFANSGPPGSNMGKFG